MDMRMVEQLLGPGVENGEHADGAPDEAAIAGELNDRFGDGLEQHTVAVTLVCAQRLAELLGHGDDDVKVGGWQHLGAAALEPGLGLIGVAFGTAAVLAGVVGEDLGAALVAAPEGVRRGFRCGRRLVRRWPSASRRATLGRR